jgi:hypothetical protein
MQIYGSAVKNSAKLAIEASPYDGRDYSIELSPLACNVLKWCEFLKDRCWLSYTNWHNFKKVSFIQIVEFLQ